MSKEPSRNLNLELSTQYYQEGTLEKDIWFRVASKDYRELMKAVDFGKLFSQYPTPMELFDVGCGTGKFPAMLQPHIPLDARVLYDYLDPSQHSLDELQRSLTPPYYPRTPLKTTLEALRESECSTMGYHIIWCIQSLYCVERMSLGVVLDKLQKLLKPDTGIAIVFLASSHAFYHILYNEYNQQFYPTTRSAFITAEEIVTNLDSLGISYAVMKLSFSHSIDSSDKQVLEKYVQQCVFDQKAFENLFENNIMGSFLESFRKGTMYEFPQEVWLLVFGSNPSQTKRFRDEFFRTDNACE